MIDKETLNQFRKTDEKICMVINFLAIQIILTLWLLACLAFYAMDFKPLLEEVRDGLNIFDESTPYDLEKREKLGKIIREGNFNEFPIIEEGL